MALIRAAAGFWIFRRLLCFLVEIKHLLSGKCQKHAYILCCPINFVSELPASFLKMNICDVVFFKGKLRSQTFFEVPPDCYCTSVNTTRRTASLIQDHAEPTPTFFTWYQYHVDLELWEATGKQLNIQPCSIILHLKLEGLAKISS